MTFAGNTCPSPWATVEDARVEALRNPDPGHRPGAGLGLMAQGCRVRSHPRNLHAPGAGSSQAKVLGHGRGWAPASYLGRPLHLPGAGSTGELGTHPGHYRRLWSLGGRQGGLGVWQVWPVGPLVGGDVAVSLGVGGRGSRARAEERSPPRGPGKLGPRQEVLPDPCPWRWGRAAPAGLTGSGPMRLPWRLDPARRREK